jgi:hypothetical protein
MSRHFQKQVLFFFLRTQKQVFFFFEETKTSHFTRLTETGTLSGIQGQPGILNFHYVHSAVLHIVFDCLRHGVLFSAYNIAERDTLIINMMSKKTMC